MVIIYGGIQQVNRNTPKSELLTVGLPDKEA